MNPVYAGFVPSGGKLFQGVHQPIISRDEWDAVAKLRSDQIAERAKLAPKELLAGLMCDCFGRSMTPNRLFRRGKLHVHYRSNQNAWGVRHQIKRLTAETPATDRLTVSALQNFLKDRQRLRSVLTDLGKSASEMRT
jgi:hypothetical protein